MLNAFSKTKEPLAIIATMLHHSVQDAPTSLDADASDIAIGRIGTLLQQFTGGVWRPLAFFSWQLRKPETKCSAFDRELLAMHLAIRHFRYFSDGRPFIVYKNHKPLTFSFSKVSDTCTARQQRQLAATSEFTTDICRGGQSSRKIY